MRLRRLDLVSPSADPVFDLKRPPPTIASPGDQDNYVGDTVSFQLVAAGGTLPRTWTLTGLPAGLAVDRRRPDHRQADHRRGVHGHGPRAGPDGNSDDATFTWTVADLPALTSPGAQVFRTGTAASLPVTLTGGLAPIGLDRHRPARRPDDQRVDRRHLRHPGRPCRRRRRPPPSPSTAEGPKSASTTFTWRVFSPVTLASPGPQSANKGDTAATASVWPLAAAETPYTWTATGLPPG